MRKISCAVLAIWACGAQAETRDVFLESSDGARLRIATLDLARNGTYRAEMDPAPFADHFLSMRPFKCLEGPDRHWSHVPYPYEIKRDISSDLTDLEYDFLFLWKGSGEYGINMWNGIYYKLEPQGQGFRGALHETDMDLLSAPPAAGDLRPLEAKDLHPGDPDSHWLPRLIIE